eukprot:GHVS01081837.1.p1 GENE.GHVS01081837.1~~GHVS01081837.1.p1  ORF type:complete len:696 (+),score=86.91 GHVS01081837.1:183-2270(+)
MHSTVYQKKAAVDGRGNQTKQREAENSEAESQRRPYGISSSKQVYGVAVGYHCEDVLATGPCGVPLYQGSRCFGAAENGGCERGEDEMGEEDAMAKIYLFDRGAEVENQVLRSHSYIKSSRGSLMLGFICCVLNILLYVLNGEFGRYLQTDQVISVRKFVKVTRDLRRLEQAAIEQRAESTSVLLEEMDSTGNRADVDGHAASGVDVVKDHGRGEKEKVVVEQVVVSEAMSCSYFIIWFSHMLQLFCLPPVVWYIYKQMQTNQQADEDEGGLPSPPMQIEEPENVTNIRNSLATGGTQEVVTSSEDAADMRSTSSRPYRNNWCSSTTCSCCGCYDKMVEPTIVMDNSDTDCIDVEDECRCSDDTIDSSCHRHRADSIGRANFEDAPDPEGPQTSWGPFCCCRSVEPVSAATRGTKGFSGFAAASGKSRTGVELIRATGDGFVGFGRRVVELPGCLLYNWCYGPCVSRTCAGKAVDLIGFYVSGRLQGMYEDLFAFLRVAWYISNLYMLSAWLWSSAVGNSSLSVGIVTAIFNTNPVFVFLFATILFGGEGVKRDYITVVAIFLAMVGVILIAYGTEGAAEINIGIVAAVGAAATYGLFELLYKHSVLGGSSNPPILMIFLFVGLMGACIGGLLWWPVVVLHYTGLEVMRMPTWQQWVVLVLNGIGITGFQVCFHLDIKAITTSVQIACRWRHCTY